MKRKKKKVWFGFVYIKTRRNLAVLDKESLESDLDPSSSKVEFFFFYFGERVLTHAR